MTHPYFSRRPARRPLGWLLLLALLLGGALAGRAQSGPYGNEWIVPGQPYYKIKVWRDGLYRLDYAYLSQLAGASSVAPSRLQLWRRGQEVAVYQGGSSTALDASTFVEFYGQRNDGALDKDYYKNRLDQANPGYSLFTDTASYFITWGSQAGKRMAQPTATGGTPHAWRLQSIVRLFYDNYQDAGDITYLPWMEPGEGFLGKYATGDNASAKNDSLLRTVATTATTLPRVELTLVGGQTNINVLGQSLIHRASVRVVPPGQSPRELGQLTFPDYNVSRGRYQLQLSDLNLTTGQVELTTATYQAAVPGSRLDYWRYASMRLTVPQQVVWFTNRRTVAFQNDSLLSGPATYDVPGVPATVYGFDVQDPWNVQRIAPGTAAAAGAARFVFPSATTAQTRNLLLADESQPLVPPAARRVNFRLAINPATPNFIVVTHPLLQKAAGTGATASTNVALDYARYRASAAGGRYDTLLVNMPLLYDQFHYGERSALALRHFALWLGNKSPATQVKYLLLLGKGLTTGAQVAFKANSLADDYISAAGSSQTQYTPRALGEYDRDLVPTTSRAPSDIFFSCDWPNNNYVPRLVTGRVVAVTATEALNYLNKLKEYEQALDPAGSNYLAAWHKGVVNLVGGESQYDFSRFGAYVDRQRFQMEHPLFGANVTTFRRTTVVPAGTGLTVPINISTQLNNGLQIINYFGHGSPNYTDLDIGDINDPLNGYNNTGKYPVMIYNGCAVGACFFAGTTFGASWLLAPAKGSIGLLSETGFSYEEHIIPQQDTINRLLFNTPAWFGKPVSEVQREAIRRLQGTATFPVTDARAIEQLMGTIWHGDPALRLFAPAKPDLQVSNSSLAIGPAAGNTSVTPTTPLVLSVTVSNPARITRDSIEIRVTRRYGSPATSVVYTFRGLPNARAFPQAFRRDTTYTIALPALPVATGDNTFVVDIDYRNKIAELDETNNTATLHYSILARSITLLAPSEFGVVATTTPQLVAQSNNLAEVLRSYDIQVDSVSTFSSAALRSATRQANTVLKFTPSALTPATGRDSVVWYWRVRFTTPATGEDGDWVTGSFRVIPGAPAGGWSQSHNGQFGRDQLTGVSVAAPSNRWSFAGTTSAVRLRTVGGGLPGSYWTFGAAGGTIQTNLLLPPNVSACSIYQPGMIAVVLDPSTLKRIVVPAPTGTTYLTCGDAGQMFYRFGDGDDNLGDSLRTINNNATYRTLLTTFLDNVPDNSYVLLVSMNRVRFASPDLATVRQKLATVLGSTLVGNLRNGEPWIIVAQKKASGGLLLAEQGADRSSATPVYAQNITLNYNLPKPGTSGQVVSTLIGPARQWQSLFQQVQLANTTGSYTLSLIGVDASSKETVLVPSVTTKTLSLAGYSATTYPYMRLRLTLNDSLGGVPPQLRQWLLAYKGLPEGVVRRELATAASPTVYDAATLARQATADGIIRFPVKFDNVAPDPFASPLQVRVSLRDASDALVKDGKGNVVQALITAPRTLGVGDSVLTVQAKLKVVGLFGTFTPVAEVNPQLQPEQYYFNNTLRLPPFTVVDTNVPPTLDVAVDGRHILNGELVSSTPTVAIQLRDEDRLRRIRQASAFAVFLQRQDQATATVVNVNGADVRFTVDSTSQAGTVARLEYYPGRAKALETGTYTLRVQGRDSSGARAGAQEYQVKFEVVKESTISNVFPYPNPVTSKARFVFTLTGSELPRNMKIQIMTLTGKVVREIFMHELGALHIGDNLTDYAWDGTDQYGDRLANGTYLYRVLLDDDGKFSQRATAGDQAFKNDWGKLVLLR